MVSAGQVKVGALLDEGALLGNGLGKLLGRLLGFGVGTGGF